MVRKPAIMDFFEREPDRKRYGAFGADARYPVARGLRVVGGLGQAHLALKDGLGVGFVVGSSKI